ncbi:hypothetical protein CKM354_000548500 [Cercospora kikuchii]|uniref:Carrier domain-containing protein n=1 Tax=Cercospora kikuchii TaxID=84275 RepID=A0A9P3CFE5_9PEZI|nr:uncharacterized protein CKM354_000548500 [Cercospora kikuchii]GIZ42207.1 hypothetical protein CKM354_000548500 [Cercospora kikuchii]
MASTVQTLFDLLRQSAESGIDAGIVAYPLHNTIEARRVTYSQLFSECRRRASLLARQRCFTRGGIILLHFNDHLDNIIWFWSVLLAGCTPALSSPLPNDLDQRRQHLDHLNKLFDAPICLTRQTTFSDFAVCPSLSLLAIDTIEAESSNKHEHIEPLSIPTPSSSDLAALMLTSGSTGNAKAVELTHQQIVASLAGKDSVTRLHDNQSPISLLNWIGMDHVAALTETHLLALYRNLNQIHIQPPDIVSDPLLLLRMIAKHRVARTVAPNFLLAALLRAVENCDENELEGIDLTTLTQLVSGGEANPGKLCAKLDEVLQKFGAPAGVLQPAFGMTETCAGCTYNLECPAKDVESGMDFASLGKPVGGFEVRVVGREEEEDSTEQLGRRGILQIRGPMVFSRYYNNPAATAEAFTEDGWFDTGDEAIIDGAGRLHLVGRIKDQIRINGVSIVASDLESQLNALSLSGAQDGFYAAFGYRPTPTSDESLAVLYLPTRTEDDVQRQATNGAIMKSVMRSHGIAPYVLPVDNTILQKSTLGKLSRGKLRRALEQGKLSSYEQANAAKTSSVAVEPRNELEAQLLRIFREALEHSLDLSTLDVVTPWFNLGITSIQLILLKRKIELGMRLAEVPLVKLLKCSTIEELAVELQPRRRRDSVTDLEVEIEEEAPSAAYDPVVKLRTQGSKAPLWLFHPGVGEVLVFINMAKEITDRPVFALRARGFNPGETFFHSIEEAVDTYYRAIKKQQPHGPYTLAGYSYGAMLAFETAKRLNNDGNGDQVEFLASFNLPPHIKFRMRQLDWRACALHLGHFLGLLHDPDLDDSPGGTVSTDHALAVKAIFDNAPQQRLSELSLTRSNFQHWANLAHEMQSMARDYEPGGRVSKMDVFYCQPLAVVAQSKQEWLDNHLRRWNDFASDVRCHEVGGEHYTMIGTDHVQAFMKTFTKALSDRGV